MYTCCIQIHSICSNMMTNQSTVVIKTCFRISLLIFSFYWMISHDIIKNINKTYFVKGIARLTPRMRHKITTMSHDYSLILISDQKQLKKKKHAYFNIHTGSKTDQGESPRWLHYEVCLAFFKNTIMEFPFANFYILC